MKICPHCQTKYTDDTLNFCLQDGKTLDSVADEKTLILDADSFADEATISEHAWKESAAGSEKTKENQIATPTSDNPSEETVINRDRVNNASFVADEIQTKKSGLSFVAGFLIGITLLGIIGGGIYGVVLYSNREISQNINSNNNSNVSDIKKERILSNSSEVTVASSSTRKNDKGNTYAPALAFDGNPRTAWAEGAAGAGVGQWIAFDFKKEVALKKIIIMPGYFKTHELWRKNNRLKSVTLQFSDQLTKVINFPDKMEEQKIDLGSIKTKSVLIRIKSYYRGQNDAKDTLLSEVSFVVE